MGEGDPQVITLPSTGEMVDRIDAVAAVLSPDDWQAGSEWYANANLTCRTWAGEYGLPTSTVAAVVSALSPQTQWSVNLRAAKRLLATGQQESATLGQNYRRAMGVLDGTVNPADWQYKIGKFWRNLSGDLQPVTIDSWAWAIVAGDLPYRVLYRKGAYALVEDAFRIVADHYGHEPATVQAATWLPFRRAGYITRMNERLGRVPA
jgi:hypothetical protein